MVTQTSRLDIHDQQINQLQQDVTEIKASLSTLMEDSREFRLAFLAWMKSQEKMHVDGSSSFGPSVLDFTSSSIRSDSPAILRSPGSGGNFGEVFPCSHPKFVSNRNVGPKSSDGDLSGGISSVIAQLEALVSRSENRLCGYGHLMLTGHTDSRSSNYGFQFPTPAPLKAIISRSEEHGCLMSHSDDGVMTDNLQGKLGSGIGVGHDVELKLGQQSYTASSMSTFGQPIQHQEETISTGVDDIDNGRTSLEQVKTEKSNAAPLKVNPESHLDADSQVFVESREQDVVTKGENYVGSTKCVAPGVESYSGVLPHCQESDVYKVVDDKTLPMEEHDVTKLKGVDSSCILFQSLNTEHRNDHADGADVFSTTTKSLSVTDPSAELHDSPSSKGLNNEPTPSIENEHKLPVTLVLHDNRSSIEGLQHFIPANFIKNSSQLQDTDTNGSLNCFEATTSCVSALPNSQLSVSCIIPEESSCLEEGTFPNVTDINYHIFQEKSVEFISEITSVGDDTLVEIKPVLQGAQFTGTNLQSLEKEREDIAAEIVVAQHQILVENQPQGLVGITHSVETHDCFTTGKSNSSVSVSQETTSTPQSCCLVGTETTYMIEAEGSKINIGEQVDSTPIVGGFQHELDDPKDTTVLTRRSDSVKRQDNSLVIHPLNAVPSSDEWLPAFEAAEELLVNEYEENGLQSYTASSMSTFGQSSQHQEETISVGVDDLDHAQTSSWEHNDAEKSKDLPPKVNPESHLDADSEVFVELHDSHVRDNVAQLLNSIPFAETSSIENKSSAEATTPCISAIRNSQLSEEGTFHNVTDINDDLFQEKRVSGAIPIGQNQDVDVISREVASLINEQVEFISETASVGDDAEGSKINIEEQADATVLTKGSNSIKRQDKSLAICPPTAVPFSDEWLAAIEAAGEEILTMKGGAVQHSPPDKSLPEPSPWSPVKKKGNQIGPYDCTKYTNAMPTSSQVSDQ